MSKEHNDRRSKRTRKLIRTALSELIEEKGFNDISITDLTTKADINRGTFYLHYSDKFDLLEKVENEVIQELYENIKDVSDLDIINKDFIEKPVPFMLKIFEYLEENALFMNAILGPKGDPVFHRKIKKLIETYISEKKLIKTFNRENTLVPEEYLIAYILSAHLGVIQQWLEGGMKKSPEEMALICTKLSLLGPFRAAGFKANRDVDNA